MPSRSSIQLTKDLMLAFAHCMLQDDHFEGALILLVSWAGYLRVSETLGLTWERMVIPGDVRNPDRNEMRPGLILSTPKLALFGSCRFASHLPLFY